MNKKMIALMVTIFSINFYKIETQVVVDKFGFGIYGLNYLKASVKNQFPVVVPREVVSIQKNSALCDGEKKFVQQLISFLNCIRQRSN